ARRSATTCVAAGTDHRPEAHRCHENSSPAPRSTGKAGQPYAGRWTSAKDRADPATATPAPYRSICPYRNLRKNASSDTAAVEVRRMAAAPPVGTGGGGDVIHPEARTAATPRLR